MKRHQTSRFWHSAAPGLMGRHRPARPRLPVDRSQPYPEMILADIVSGSRSLSPAHVVPTDKRPPVHKRAPVYDLEKSTPQFVVTFIEDKNGFYINGQKFTPDADPMVRVQVGSHQHWRTVNETRVIHPFHIHQVHFSPMRKMVCCWQIRPGLIPSTSRMAGQST
jgi:FtsP/CotA-like multicopper oxidase with cupredoxin domain